MSFKKATVSIRGVSPLIWHAFNVNAISTERKEKTGVAGNNPEEWRDTVLCDKDGRLFITKNYIFGCLRAAAQHTKVGKGNLKSKVGATLQVLGSNDIYVSNRKLPKPLQDLKSDELSTSPKSEVYLDICSVVNPSTKGRNIRYRVASSPGWILEFQIGWDTTIVGEKHMESVLKDAGTLIGLADGRSIGNGRFVVDSWKTESVESLYD